MDECDARGQGFDDDDTRGRGLDDDGARGRGLDDDGARGQGLDDDGARGRGLDDDGARGQGLDDDGARGLGFDNDGAQGLGPGVDGAFGSQREHDVRMERRQGRKRTLSSAKDSREGHGKLTRGGGYITDRRRKRRQRYPRSSSESSDKMALLVVESETLGQKHKNYNTKLNAVNQEVIPEINYDDPDLDNLLRIDIACRNRNVDYIIKVLQWEDMLYVSRAITRSTWIITDPQYADIINPTYLNDQLSPKMMSKAFNKLLLHIRLNLKNEKRVEEFFNYYKERGLRASFKWLPHCSLQFTEKIIQKHAQDIPKHLVKRICEKSITCLELFMRSSMSYYKRDVLAPSISFLNKNTEKYLDIVEACKKHEVPRFGPKATKLIMRKYNERVMKNLEKYAYIIHVPTFVKFIKTEDIKDFITTNINNSKLHSWFTYSNIKKFVNRLPVESRFEFVKETFIDKKQEEIVMQGQDASNYQNIYRWYVYASFDTACTDLEKLIRLESNPKERISMCGVLLKCADKDMKNIQNVLKYYRDYHINEPFKFKIQVVNLIISHTNTHKFDAETWGYLNDLFSSMDVYCESDKLDQNCVRAIILYNIIHDEEIPDIVQKKFEFDTYKLSQKKLSENEKKKVFSYLYKNQISKIDTTKINDVGVFYEHVQVLRNLTDLLVDWNKELKDFPDLLEKIKEMVLIGRELYATEEMSVVYHAKKTWRKLLFNESIIMSPTQEACINALKHGPQLLKTYKYEVECLCLKNIKSIDRFLKKVRIYMSQSLANTYKNFFLSKMDTKNTHKAAVMGLCTLLSKNDLSSFVGKYVPKESKIDWSEFDDVELSLCKNIASNLHLARPQPSLATALLFAKGDYLQFVLPSLSSILYNMSSVQIRKYLTPLLDSPVSLQKHGIRAAFAKLQRDEIKNLFSDIWKTNKNTSIRAAIFIQTLDFLRKQTEPSATREVWELLSVFIDSLTSEENKTIYTKMSKVRKVPMSVRPQFWMKSYKFLKSLPTKANCESLLGVLRNNMDDLMEFLDDDFMAEIFLESLEENFSTKRYEYQDLVVEFVLSTRSEQAHIARYNKIFVPILEQALAMWNKSHENTNYEYVRKNLKSLISYSYSRFHDFVIEKNMVRPFYMYTNVLKWINENLPSEENYIIATTQKLALDFVKIIDKVLKTDDKLTSKAEGDDNDNDDKYKEAYAAAASELGKLSVSYLKEDVASIFPTIYIFFAEAYNKIFYYFEFSEVNKMNSLKAFLEDKDFIPGYLFILKALPPSVYYDNEIALKSELLKDISAHPSKEVKMHLRCV